MWILLPLLPAIYFWWKLQETEKERHLLLGLLSGVLADHPEAMQEYQQALSTHELMGSSYHYKAGFEGSKSEMERQIKVMKTAVSLAEYTRH